MHAVWKPFRNSRKTSPLPAAAAATGQSGSRTRRLRLQWLSFPALGTRQPYERFVVLNRKWCVSPNMELPLAARCRCFARPRASPSGKREWCGVNGGGSARAAGAHGICGIAENAAKCGIAENATAVRSYVR